MEAEISITKLLSDCIVNVCQTYVKFSTNISVSGNLRFSVDESKYFYVNVNERLKSEVLNLLKESQTGVDICDCSSHQLLLDQSYSDGQQGAPPVLQPVIDSGQSSQNNTNTQTFPANTTHLPHMADLATSLSQDTSISQSSISLDNGMIDAVKQEPTSHASYGRPNADIKPEIVELSDDDEDGPSSATNSSYNQGLPVYNAPSTSANLDTTSLLRAQAESVYQSLMQQPTMNTTGTPSHMNIQPPPSNQQFMLPNQASVQSPQQMMHTQSPYTPRHFSPRQYTPRRKTPGSGAKRGGMMGSVRHRTPSSVKKAMTFKRTTPSSSYTPMAGAMNVMAGGEQSAGMMQQGLQIGNVQSFGDDKDAIQQGIMGADNPGATPTKKKRRSQLSALKASLPSNASFAIKYHCSHPGCGAHYNSTGDLGRHRRVAHEGVRYTCTLCSKTFGYKHALKSHMDKVHGSQDMAFHS